jgi:hypothetical protein
MTTSRQRRKVMNKVIEPALLRELQGLIGNAYCSNKLSEEAFNHWLKLANLNQEEEASE